MSRKKYVNSIALHLISHGMGKLEANQFVDKIYEQGLNDGRAQTAKQIEHYKDIIAMRELLQKQHEDIIANLEKQATIMEESLELAKKIMSKQDELLKL